MKSKTIEPELSRPVAVDKIPPNGLDQTIDAGEQEREKLAGRFGLLRVSKLSAKLAVHPAQAGRAFAVTGRMQADVVQQCVVSLEPLPAHIEQGIDVVCALPSAEPGEEEDEDMEPIVNGEIDLGELVAQHLGVALDPYPRKPGLAYVEASYEQRGSQGNPLSSLVEWPKKPK